MDVFPFPQTYVGRSIDTAARDPNWGDPFRVTSPQASSVIDSLIWADQGWAGSPVQQQENKAIVREESRVKAEKAGGASTKTVDTVVGLFGTFVEGSQRASTWADKILGPLPVQSVNPGAKVKGFPVSPTEVHYRPLNSIDQKMGDLRKAGDNIVTQVKGMFNIALDRPGDSLSPVTLQTAQAVQSGQGLIFAIVMILLLYMVTK